jgi:hypothetical protein
MAVVAVNILRRPILSARTAETGMNKAKTRQKIIVLIRNLF